MFAFPVSKVLTRPAPRGPDKPTNKTGNLVTAALQTPGQSLDATTRQFFEPRFKYDFGSVRIHADDRAAQSAQAISALAFTQGRDICFGAGQYSPRSASGKRLLAHELAHVVQQSTVPNG